MTTQTKKAKTIKVKFTTLEVGQEFATDGGELLWRKTLTNKNFKGLESGEAILLKHDEYPCQVGRIKYFNHVANALISA